MNSDLINSTYLSTFFTLRGVEEKSLYHNTTSIFSPYFVYLLILFLLFNSSPISAASLTKGRLLITHEDLVDGVLELDGEATFYHESFLDAAAIEKDSLDFTYILVSQSWDSQPKEYISYDNIGYGTYHFKLIIPSEYVGKSLILRPTHYISYASQTYINGTMCSHNGSVGKSIDDPLYQPSRHTQAYSFKADTNVLDVVIWVSNFHHFRGGVLRSFIMGPEEEMTSKRERTIFLDLLVIISLFIMALYHAVLFIVNREIKTSFYFALLCLILSADLTFRGSMSFFLLFPNSPFAFYSIFHIITSYLIPGAFMMFLGVLFPKHVSKFVINFSVVLGLIVSLLTIFGSLTIAHFVLKPFYVFTGFITLYGFYLVIHLLREKVYASTLFAIAYSIFGLCAANDVLDLFEVIQSTNLLALGTIVFIFLLSILYGKQNARLQQEVDIMASDLKHLNLGLEQQVVERTNALDSSLSDLSNLNTFQEGMTHLIAHDLKSPLMQIINIDQIREKDYPALRDSGYRMLNMIQNMLDLYRFNNHRVVLRKVPFNVYKAVDDVIREFTFFSQKKAIKIEVIQYETYSVEADIHMFKQVISNLISNALRFSPVGGLIQIRISADIENNLKITVSNEGPGLTDEESKLIFSKKSINSRTTDSKARNSGLGLTLCKMAVEEHGGNIGVQSFESEMGLLFWFTLPDVKRDDKAPRTAVIKYNESIVLSSSDLTYLRPYAEQISSLEIFETTRIDSILNEIEHRNLSIERWCAMILNMSYQLDEAKLNETLSLVLNENKTT